MSEETVTIASKVEQNLSIGSITVFGRSRVPPGTSRQQPEMGGFVLTPNFPKYVWDEWFKHNQSSHMVQAGMIFADTDGNVRARLMPTTIGRPVQFGEIPYKG